MAASRVLAKLIRSLPSRQPSRTLNIQLFGTSNRSYSSALTSTALKDVTDPAQGTRKRFFIQSHQNTRQISTSDERQSGDVDALRKDEDDEGDFNKYDISPETQAALRAHGIEKLFPVQSMGYKYITDGRDVVVKARTGTGKTLAFSLPLVEKLLHRNKRPRDRPKAIVLTPTRELANQVEEHTRRLNRKTRIACVFGGASYMPQERAIRDGLDIVVGTPGRMKDMIDKGTLNLDEIEHVILDEVDRMLDMGFQDIVDQILGSCYAGGSKPQTLMFSATVPQFVKQAAQKYLSKDVLLIDLIGDDNVQSATTINQMALQCEFANREVLRNLIRKYCPGGKTIVFCETKRECDRVATLLTGGRTLHGDVSQVGRNDIIRSFKSGKLNILVTTDVAARGLDIPNVDLVIQTSPPNDKDNFIHRTGRTGRAGNTGNAIMLYKRENAFEVGLCEKIAKTKLIRIQAPSLDLKTLLNSSDRMLNRINVNDAMEVCGEKAQELMDRMGGVETLSQALVHLCNIEDALNKSLLTSTKNYRTFVYTSSDGKISTQSFKEKLENVLGSNKDQVKGLCGSKTGNAVAFDVPKTLTQVLTDGIPSQCPNGVLTKQVHKLPEDIESHAYTSDDLDLDDEDSSSFRDRDRSSFRGSRFGERRPSFEGSRSGNRYASDPSSDYGDRNSAYGGNRSQYGGSYNRPRGGYDRSSYSSRGQSYGSRYDRDSSSRGSYGNRNRGYDDEDYD